MSATYTELLKERFRRLDRVEIAELEEQRRDASWRKRLPASVRFVRTGMPDAGQDQRPVSD